jgi:hypothetical protein
MTAATVENEVEFLRRQLQRMMMQRQLLKT